MSAAELSPFRLPQTPTEIEIVAKYFRGLGDPIRLQILQLLRERESSVQEIVKKIELPQPRISNHLACLRWCGFVDTRRDHRTIYYHVADRRVSKMIDLAQDLLEQNAEHIAACRRIDNDA